MDPFYKVKVKDLSDNQKELIVNFTDCEGECDSCPLNSVTGLFGCLFLDIVDTDQDFEVSFTKVDGVEQIYVE